MKWGLWHSPELKHIRHMGGVHPTTLVSLTHTKPQVLTPPSSVLASTVVLTPEVLYCWGPDREVGWAPNHMPYVLEVQTVPEPPLHTLLKTIQKIKEQRYSNSVLSCEGQSGVDEKDPGKRRVLKPSKSDENNNEKI